jgi:hypothetical protein
MVPIVGSIAGEKVEKKLGLLPEQGFGFLTIEEMLLVGRAFIGVAGRHGDSLNTQSRHIIEKRGDPGRIRGVEEGAIDGHPEATLLGAFQGGFVPPKSCLRQ